MPHFTFRIKTQNSSSFVWSVFVNDCCYLVKNKIATIVNKNRDHTKHQFVINIPKSTLYELNKTSPMLF